MSRESVVAKPTPGDKGKGTGYVGSAIEKQEQLRQRTADLETALLEAERINQSLRESEAQFRSMADNSLIGIAIIEDGRHTYTNRALNETFGYSAEEMLLLNPLALTAECDRAFASEKLRQALASEIERTEFSLKALRKDGTLLDLEVSGSAMMVAGKRALIVLTRDVSLRTLAEGRLRESEESLRTVAASVSDAILMIDNDGKITFWNDAAQRIFGYSGDEVIGREMHELLAAPQYRQSYREPFARFRKTGEGAAIGELRELSAMRKGGTEFPIELSLASVKIEGKWNAVGVVRDVSDRKLLERTREERSERILAHAAALEAITIAERRLDTNLNQLSRVIDEQLALATSVARASIWLFNAQETQLHCIDLYELGDARHSDGAILSEEQFASEFEALKSAPCIAADDALTDPRTSGYAETYLKPLGITSMLDAVIEVSGKHLGVLCLEHVRRVHHWREDEIASTSEVAARIGLALLTRSRMQAERALRESERRLSSIFDNVELISIMLDSEARLTYCNDYLLRLSGWEREEIIGRRWQEVFWLPQDAKRMQSILSNALTGNASAWHHESQIVMRNGESRTVYWNNTVLRSPEGVVLGVASLGQDITEREAAQKELKLFRALVDESNDAIELIDSETSRLIDVNKRACVDLGYSRDELLCLSISDIDGDSDPANASAIEEGLANEGFVVVESSHRRKDGSVFPVELSLRRIALDKSYVVAVARDISERKRAEAEMQALQDLLREQAIHDPLTGLYNRRFLEESLDRELIRAKRSGACVSAIMGDLDHFKRVNDEYGHRAGDEVLRTFAKLLKANLRGSDVDCRYGGEEFLLLLPGSTNKTACERAEVLRAALAATSVPFEGADIAVTGSFGVATYPEHALTGDNLIEAADSALYAAKESGRNRVMSCSQLGIDGQGADQAV
jgi:diguanylate cyclase (GGDEF)-like protein/PAS domain S-box-containing protein